MIAQSLQNNGIEHRVTEGLFVLYITLFPATFSLWAATGPQDTANILIVECMSYIYTIDRLKAQYIKYQYKLNEMYG